MRFRLGVADFLLIFPAACLCLPAALAQLAPSTDAPPVSTAPAPQPEQPVAPTLRIRVNLVDLFFTVKDRSGTLVPHLTQEDCSVIEDQQSQTLKSFTAETSQPLTLGILLDTSGSQSRVLPREQQAASSFIERVLQPQDEAFLLSFDVNVDLLQDFTNSAPLLSAALNRAQINTAGGNGAAGIPGAGGGTVPSIGEPRGTLLYDALSEAAARKMTQETGRKALLLLTDGQDQGSRASLRDAIAAAQKSNLIVYVILIADRSLLGEFDSAPYTAMKKITEETGGRLIEVGSNVKKLDAAFQQIEDELRTQYLASYVSTNPKMDGSFRRISVSCRNDSLKVQVRKGYFALAAQY